MCGILRDIHVVDGFEIETVKKCKMFALVPGKVKFRP